MTSTRVVKFETTWTEDRAPVKDLSRADPGAETEGRAVTFTGAARPSLRDRHSCEKPSRPEAATTAARSRTVFSYAQPARFQFTVNQDTRTFPMATVSYPHIEIAADGTALVEGTRTKVVEIALDRLAHHWDAEEIQRQHPHLTLAQIYAALTYYHDHRQHFDSEIRDQLKDVDLIASRQEPSLVREKLRTAGKNT